MNRREQKRLSKTGQPITKLHVLGAAGGVTGSLNLIEYFERDKVTRFILDTGLTVEDEGADFQNRFPAGITAGDIDFVIISHAHIDHSGFLPKLVKDGFKGPAYMTAPTRDLLHILLPDSGYLQEEATKRCLKRASKSGLEGDCGHNVEKGKKCELNHDAPGLKGSTAAKGSGGNVHAKNQRGAQGRNNKQGKHNGRSQKAENCREPLYTREDAVRALKCLKTLDYDKRHELSDGIQVTLTEAGHILGSAVVNLEIGKGSNKRTFCFTGNIGRPGMPLLRELAPVKGADYVMAESTYGNKAHQRRDRLEALAGIITSAHERALEKHPKFGCGVIVIPAFAVGRVQTVINDLRQLMKDGRIPTIPVYLDSPMAIEATEIHRRHSGVLNAATRAVFEAGGDAFVTPNHALCRDWQSSVKLDEPQSQPIIIIGSSGMASGGRVVAHLKARLPNKQNTIVFVGFQGTGTLGRTLVSRFVNTEHGAKAEKSVASVRIAGSEVKVQAKVELMSDYSGHADYLDTLAWLGKFTRKPKNTFLVHGDPDALEALKEHIETRLRWTVTVPKARETFTL